MGRFWAPPPETYPTNPMHDVLQSETDNSAPLDSMAAHINVDWFVACRLKK